MGQGFKVWATGDLINASDFNNYIQEQVVMVFADASARTSAISSPEEGMFAFLKDSDTLTFYDGSSWVSFIGEGDITGITITTNATGGLSGGTSATSGAFSSTLTFTPNGLSAGAINVANDSFVIIDADDSNNPKKESIADLVSAIAGTNLTASSGQLNATAGGISMLDVFKLTADITATNGDITANLSRVSYSGFSQLGTGMTESSGIFTFPATGFYEVIIQPNFEINNDPSAEVVCVFSNDNFSSEQNVMGVSMGNRSATGAHFYQFEKSVILDITDVSTHKVKFKTDSFASATVLLDDNTRFVFKKLADT